MADQLRNIVQELSKAPFNKTYNLISFDSLEPIQLLQVLSDVFTTVQDVPVVDIRAEAAEDTAFRMLTTLRILKYPAPTDAESLSTFRQGLVEGDKHAIYPILLWIFSRVTDLQKRLYLAKYLVKVEVPPEFLQDIEVEELYQRCEALKEEFKQTHKTSESYMIDGATSEDIRQDIKSMELERDQVSKRIDKIKKKVEHAPQKEKLMLMARNLRMESDREFQLSHQKQEQRNALVHAEQKYQRLSQQIKEIHQNVDNHNPEDVVKRLEEETRTQAYLAEEKLPKEITSKRKAVQELQKVLSMPALDQKDIDQIQSKIDEVNSEINQLVEDRNVKSDPTEDKVAVYRQQAAMVTRKKENIAEQLQQQRLLMEDAQRELDNRKHLYRDEEGNEIITQTQFKNYLAHLRTKSNHYKRKRQEINDLKAEVGVLMRTCEILSNQAAAAGAEIDENEPVADDSAPAVTAVDLQGKSNSEVLDMAKVLRQNLGQKQTSNNGLMNELRPLRQEIEGLNERLEGAKRQYNSTAANFESSYAALDETVKRLWKDMNDCQSEIFRLEVEKRLLDARLEQANEESNAGQQQPLRSAINNKIQQAEAAAKKLRDEQKTVGEKQNISTKQLKTWKDLAVIMEHKKKNLERQQRILRESSAQNRWQGDRSGSGSRHGSGKV